MFRRACYLAPTPSVAFAVARVTLLAAVYVRLGTCVSIASPRSVVRPQLARVELRSSGALQDIGIDGTADTIGDAKAWPATAVVKGEVNLGRLHGGTRPEKVRIGKDTFVRKKALEGEPQAIMMEALANNIYEAAQVTSEHCRYYPAANGAKAYMLCRWIDGLHPIMDFTEEVRKFASQNFVLDAALGNYDVGGTTGDNKHRYPRGNIGWGPDKQLIRVDNGGALAADGMGVWKPTEYQCKGRLGDRMTTWSREPFSLWDFRRYSDVYAQLSRKDIEAQVHTVVGMKDALLGAVDAFKSVEASEKVKKTLAARLDCLGRVAKERPDLFDVAHLQDHSFFSELPKAVCEGVRSVCADLLVQKRVAHVSP